MTSLISSVQSGFAQAANAAKTTLNAIAPTVKTCAKVALVALAGVALARMGIRSESAASTQLVPAAPPRTNPDFTPAHDPRYPRTEENRLPFEYRFMASQDYIDNVQPSDLKEPVMWGIDARGRAFWSAKVICHKKDGTTSRGVVTWFQRYTGEPLLVHGSHHMPMGCSSLGDLDPIYRSREFPDAMTRLLKGERVSANIEEDEFFDNYYYELARN